MNWRVGIIYTLIAVFSYLLLRHGVLDGFESWNFNLMGCLIILYFGGLIDFIGMDLYFVIYIIFSK